MITPLRLVTPPIFSSTQSANRAPSICAPENWASVRLQRSNRTPLRSAFWKLISGMAQSRKTTFLNVENRNAVRSARQESNVTSLNPHSDQVMPVNRLADTRVRCIEADLAAMPDRSQRSSSTLEKPPRRIFVPENRVSTKRQVSNSTASASRDDRSDPLNSSDRYTPSSSRSCSRSPAVGSGAAILGARGSFKRCGRAGEVRGDMQRSLLSACDGRDDALDHVGPGARGPRRDARRCCLLGEAITV